MDAYEMAQSKADPDRGWEEGYSGSGIWICYQDNWWEALADGDILTRNNGRIDAADCTGIYRLAKDAATRLGLKQPVRPDHIHNTARQLWILTEAIPFQTLKSWRS